MIFVEDVKIKYCKGKSIFLSEFKNPEIQMLDTDYFEKPTSHKTEEIQGEFFRNNEGKGICIGWSKDVQDALGLPFKCFERQQNTIHTLYDNVKYEEKRVKNLTNQLNKFKYAGFLKRLKFLFTKEI